MKETYKFPFFEFPKPLDVVGSIEFSRFLGKKIRGYVDAGTLEDRGIWPIAFVFKKYNTGVAYARLCFRWIESKEKTPFVGFGIRTETSFRNRQTLTQKLTEDITKCYKKFKRFRE